MSHTADVEGKERKRREVHIYVEGFREASCVCLIPIWPAFFRGYLVLGLVMVSVQVAGNFISNVCLSQIISSLWTHKLCYVWSVSPSCFHPPQPLKAYTDLITTEVQNDVLEQRKKQRKPWCPKGPYCSLQLPRPAQLLFRAKFGISWKSSQSVHWLIMCCLAGRKTWLKGGKMWKLLHFCLTLSKYQCGISIMPAMKAALFSEPQARTPPYLQVKLKDAHNISKLCYYLRH